MKKKFIIPAQSASRGLHINSGTGPVLQIIDINHAEYTAVIDPDSAFWSLIAKEQLGSVFEQKSPFLKQFLSKKKTFLDEMQDIRFNAKHTAVYFNPTQRCNLDCTYCYLPRQQRRKGFHMSRERLLEAMEILRTYFKQTLPKEVHPQIIFHGAEPMLVRDAIFEAIEIHGNYFRFGIQTNGTLLDNEATSFIISHNIGLGLSLDGHIEGIADLTRSTWSGASVFSKVVKAIEGLKGYSNYNVICTATRENMSALSDVVDFLHKLEVPVAMLNPVRCTSQGARKIKPVDQELSFHYLKALDRTFELYQKTKRKLVIANFANILISIMAPAARKLMCDISPCGGGRCFFAVSADGDLFPCSEFLGVTQFKGGNLFEDTISSALKSSAFQTVTTRTVENIEPCSHCAIRHFCGSPCPAEAYEMNGGMDKTGAFCELYEDQVRYALRLIADKKADFYLMDGWDNDTTVSMDMRDISL